MPPHTMSTTQIRERNDKKYFLFFFPSYPPAFLIKYANNNFKEEKITAKFIFISMTKTEYKDKKRKEIVR